MYDPTTRFRPMDLGDILNTTFNLYRDNFLLFAGIVAVIAIPVAILTAALAVSSNLLFILLGAVLAAVAQFLVIGAMAEAVSARYLGQPMTISGAYEALGTNTLMVLIGASLLAGLATVIGLILLIIPGIYIGVRLAFVAQAVVLERRGATDSLSRSWDLVGGNWWRVFGIVLVVTILVSVLEQIVGGILGAGMNHALGSGIAAAIVGTFIQPIQAIALTLLYYDLRIRKEGAGVQEDRILTPTP